VGPELQAEADVLHVERILTACAELQRLLSVARVPELRGEADAQQQREQADRQREVPRERSALRQHRAGDRADRGDEDDEQQHAGHDRNTTTRMTTTPNSIVTA